MLAFDRHVCLTRVKPLDVRGEWNDLDPVEELVRGVITDDDGGALLSDLAAGHRISFRIDLTEYHLQFRSREMGSRRYCFLSEDAYIDSSLSPRMTYDKLRCITVSYWGLGLFHTHSRYFSPMFLLYFRVRNS